MGFQYFKPGGIEGNGYGKREFLNGLTMLRFLLGRQTLGDGRSLLISEEGGGYLFEQTLPSLSPAGSAPRR